MIYRPNGFKEILRNKMNEAVVARGALPLFDEDYADIGADAMLEGLRNRGYPNQDPQISISHLDAIRHDMAGTWVFIPDEE